MINTAPAIANSVYRAVGAMIVDLAITPEKILKGFEEKVGKMRLPDSFWGMFYEGYDTHEP